MENRAPSSNPRSSDDCYSIEDILRIIRELEARVDGLSLGAEEKELAQLEKGLSETLDKLDSDCYVEGGRAFTKAPPSSDNNSSVLDIVRWTIHFEKMPVAAQASFPLTWKQLRKRFDLSQESFDNLKRMSSSCPKFDLDLQICIGQASVVFLCDPIFVDIDLHLGMPAGSPSWVIGWANIDEPLRNGTGVYACSREKIIHKIRAEQMDLHTFLYKPGKELWYYIGLLNWQLFGLIQFWPELSEVSRQHLSEKLHEHYSCREEVTACYNALDGWLVQTSWQLRGGKQYLVKTMEFARDVLHFPDPNVGLKR
ncbi:hypothetical protein DL96DRAFT_1707209 [Flagelloscypha sp. PMI_526]|nr:hypothetical protein DL96DRAFT_1707209 [Flagelloscypha sp. PMI_526]